MDSVLDVWRERQDGTSCDRAKAGANAQNAVDTLRLPVIVDVSRQKPELSRRKNGNDFDVYIKNIRQVPNLPSHRYAEVEKGSKDHHIRAGQERDRRRALAELEGDDRNRTCDESDQKIHVRKLAGRNALEKEAGAQWFKDVVQGQHPEHIGEHQRRDGAFTWL